MRISRALFILSPWRCACSVFRSVEYRFKGVLDSVYEHLLQSGNERSAAVLTRARLAKSRVRLRQALRRTPYWAEGHIALGHVELALHELAPERPDPKLLATVQVSIDAARELLSPQAASAGPGRVLLEADYLNGCVLFFQRKFGDALQKFQWCLEPANAQILNEKVCDACLEYAGSSALMLENEEAARDYFLRVPASRRSAKVDAMIETLKSKYRT